MYFPAGHIDSGCTQYMATSFTVPAFAVAGPASAGHPTTISIPASGPSPHVTAAPVVEQPPQGMVVHQVRRR
jgi:hypothetical protein